MEMNTLLHPPVVDKSKISVGKNPLVTPALEDAVAKREPIIESRYMKQLAALKANPQYYQVVNLVLTVARTDEVMNVSGNFIFVVSSDAADFGVRFNEPENDLVNLFAFKGLSCGIYTPMYRLFLTHTAQSGKLLTFVVGRDDLFIVR